VLLFGTAGLAYGELTGTSSGNPSQSHASLGWVAGLGAEVSFAQHWSAKAEWLYFNLDDRHFSVTAANNGLAANLMRLDSTIIFRVTRDDDTGCFCRSERFC